MSNSNVANYLALMATTKCSTTHNVEKVVTSLLRIGMGFLYISSLIKGPKKPLSLPILGPKWGLDLKHSPYKFE